MKLWFKLLIIVAITIWLAVLTIPDDKLHIVVCNVGQGDAILIYQGTNQILVDGGPDDKVLDCLSKHMPFYDRRIETAILTHDNADHSKGLTYVAERYTVLHFEPKMRQGSLLKMGKIVFSVIWPDARVLGAGNISADNEMGIVGKLKYGNFDMLLTADTGAENYSADPNVEVVKVPHHGSLTGLSKNWIANARAKLAIISVGKRNRFGHPNQQIVDWFKETGTKVMRTDTDGEIELISDGVRWWVSK